jgi:hypothetical protein
MVGKSRSESWSVSDGQTIVRGEIYTREGRGYLTVTSREAEMEMVTHKRRVTTRTLPDQTQPNCALVTAADISSFVPSVFYPAFCQNEVLFLPLPPRKTLSVASKVQYLRVHFIPLTMHIYFRVRACAPERSHQRHLIASRVPGELPCASAAHCEREYLML